MSGDGVSLQTTISQSGAVARTQSKGQAAQQPAAPFSEKVDPGKDTHVERVRPGDRPEKGRVREDEERREGRRARDRQDGPDEGDEERDGQSDPDGNGAAADADGDEIGRHVDCLA